MNIDISIIMLKKFFLLIMTIKKNLEILLFIVFFIILLKIKLFKILQFIYLFHFSTVI